jgi:hypothetical protein
MSVLNLLLGAGAKRSPSRQFITSGEDNSALSSYTFTTPNWGAGTTKTIALLVAVRATGTRTYNAPTLGGQTATQRAEINVTTGGFLTRLAIYTLDVTSDPANTNIVISFSSSVSRVWFGLYSLYDITSSTPVTSASTSNTSTLSATLASLQTTDAVLAVAYDQGGGSSTWSGVTEDSEGTYGTSASTLVTTAGNLGVSATVSTAQYSALIAAAWR